MIKWEDFLDTVWTVPKIINNIIPIDVNTLDMISYKTCLAINAVAKWLHSSETNLTCVTNTHHVLQDKHNCEYFFGMATWKQIVLVNKQK